jgi:nucleoid-associated protein YgaU
MNRVPQRLWIGLTALACLWIIAYWLAPSPAGPIVSTPDELRLAAGRAEQRLAESGPGGLLPVSGGGPVVTVVPRPGASGARRSTSPLPTASTPNAPDAGTTTAGPDSAATDGEPGAPPADNARPDREPPHAIIPPTFQIYTVAAGDTMSSVSERFYGTPIYAGQIARANPTVDPIRLRPNTELMIPTDPRNIQGIPADPALQPGDPEPAFIEYEVVKNDTLSDIARSFYGRSALWTHIRDANPQINRDATNLRPGMTIRIPPPPPPRMD